MNTENVKREIAEGNVSLGIELGSTRIKAVLISSDNQPAASGAYEWKSSYINNIWTYSIEDVWKGIASCYADMKADVQKKYGVTIQKIASIGISAMMHGYMVFNKENELLVPFRTWQNTMTKEAAESLTELFHFQIPQRWSIAHLYQAILNKEPHVGEIDFQTTLAGYVHWMLTGEKVLGIGEASGMFPIDCEAKDFDQTMKEKFQKLPEVSGYDWKLADILPKVLVAGEKAGVLTKEGAALLDKDNDLQPGSVFCPPEGDAGTGMTATNSISVRTGNVSAGTSIFSMVVLEKNLSKVYEQIDMVTTPDGNPVAMVHCNNCSSDLNAWVALLEECLGQFGVKPDKNELFQKLFQSAMEGDADCGQLLSYNYMSGEHITEVLNGRPMFVRMPDSRMTLANFMRTQLYASISVLKIGMDILLKEENIQLDKIYGHGGLFKTKKVAQRILASAIQTPVSLMETAGEGGAWGIALLAAYSRNHGDGGTLSDFLNGHVFHEAAEVVEQPEKELSESFEEYIGRYKTGLEIERAAGVL